MRLVKISYLFFFLCIGVLSLSFREQQEEHIPIPSKEIADLQVKDEIQAIKSFINGGKHPNQLIDYNKLSTKKDNLSLRYKSDGWQFYINFGMLPNEVDQVNNSVVFTTYVTENMIESLSFYHVKYMANFDSHSLPLINSAFMENFKGEKINFLIRSFISTDFKRNYLYIKANSGRNSNEMFFIVKDSKFYACAIDIL